MWLIAGTVPEDTLGLSLDAVWGESHISGNKLVMPDGGSIPICRGTAALAATALAACQCLDVSPPRLLLAGDAGKGEGSHKAYDWLSANMSVIAERLKPFRGITFHYFYPDVDGHNRVFMAAQALSPKPMLVADAGFMYVAKMSGYASSYDLFTPDLGEMAFLADEKAPHPFYTRGFLLACENDFPMLLKAALASGNCPSHMIVKGQTDHIICDGEVAADIEFPSSPAMECIGGTGDMVTGLATAFLAAGLTLCQSAIGAAKICRIIAERFQPNPATQVSELIGRMVSLAGDEIRATGLSSRQDRQYIPQRE